MVRVLGIRSRGGALTLDGTAGVKARIDIKGFGMPPVEVQWFDGAGDGSSFRGGRTLPRTIDMPVKIHGADREEVQRRFSSIARILGLDNAPATLTAEYDGEAWEIEVIRVNGGDYSYENDTDGKTLLMTTIVLQAGMPYFERVDAEGRQISPEGVGLGLLGPGQSLVQMILSSTDGTGDVDFVNTGDVDAWPIWTFYAPFDAFAISRAGLALAWTGTVRKATGFIEVNTLEGTVRDETGANRYAELSDAPRFFPVPVGESVASVVIPGATGTARAEVRWRPRRLVMF